MYYVAHYECGSYWEPAEGGYFVETAERDWYLTFKSMKSARRALKWYARELGYTACGIKMVQRRRPTVDRKTHKAYDIMYADEDYLESRYVGDGEFLVMERGWKEHAKGYQPYC